MPPVLQDPVDETRRILALADERGIVLRALGGIAVALRSPSVRQLDPPRTYHDMDLAARGGSSAAIDDMFTMLGYTGADQFNKLNGSERLLFHDSGGRRVDVFVDRLRMCHTLEFEHRIGDEPLTLPLADLVLSKLQIVEMTPRDAQDLLALFADHPLAQRGDGGIELPRILDLCASDWAWWRTVTANLRVLCVRWSAAGSPLERTAGERADELLRRLDEVTKGIAWRARAWIGERKRWYDLPEEVR